MNDLVLKIRADAKGVRPEIKGIADETDGLELSSRKASTAMRGFVQDLSQARNASDVASAALGAFSKILGTTLAGTAVVMAGKVIIDSFQKVTEGVEKAKDSLASARDEIAKMGAVTGLAEGAAQANLLYKAASDAEKAIKEIEKSRLQNFIAEIRGAKDELTAMALEAKASGDALKLRGIQAEAAALAVTASLTEEDKAVRKVTEKYDSLIKAARELGDTQLLTGLQASQQIAAIDALEKHRANKAEAAKQESLKIAQELAENAYKLIDEEFSLEYKRNKELAEQSLKSQEELQKIEQERIRAKEKAGQEEEALMDRLISLNEKFITAQERVNAAREKLIQAEAAAAEASLSMTGSGRGPGQRESSAEVGARRRADQEETRARQKAADEEYKAWKKSRQQEGEPSDRYAYNRYLEDQMREAAKAKGEAPFTEQKEARENMQKSEEYLKNINDLLEETMEKLTSYAHAK